MQTTVAQELVTSSAGSVVSNFSQGNGLRLICLGSVWIGTLAVGVSLAAGHVPFGPENPHLHRLPPYVPAAGFATLAFALIAAASVARRLLAGATPSGLARDRFYELPSARALVYIGYVLVHIALGFAILFAVRFGYLAYESFQKGHGSILHQILLGGSAMASAFALDRLRKSWKWGILNMPKVAPPAIDVAVRQIASGINPERFRLLGSERFPNRVHRYWKRDLKIRRFLIAALALTLAAIAWAAWCEAHDQRPPSTLLSGLVDMLSGVHGALLRGSGDLPLLFAYIAAGLLFVSHRQNKDYLLVPFYSVQAINLILLVIFTICASAAGPMAGLMALGLACGAWLIRLADDLGRARRFAREQAVYAPLSSMIQRHVPFLPRVRDDSGCVLPRITPSVLSQRISRGASNIAEAGPLVTRNFGRYMRLAEAFHETCTTAMLRFMTVDRYVGVSAGWSTWASLREVAVPVWNEEMFPLDVPIGYVNRLDPLVLPASYNVVRVCGQCSGSGKVWVTEYYYETEYYTEQVNGQSVSRSRQVQRSRQVLQTCPSCSGTGRLEHNQILYTRWNRLIPATVHPHVPMPQLVEDAEEETFYRLPLVENRARGRFDSQTLAADPALARQMEAAGGDLAALHDQSAARQATELLGGTLYRSEFAICGFHTINIQFKSLGRRLGWFFGRRPEFYFPRLPLSWSMLGTYLFAAPAALAAWIVFVMALVGLLSIFK